MKGRQLFYRDMTAVHIRGLQETSPLEVVFLESARFYKLPRSVAGFDTLLARLQNAIASGRSLNIGLASQDSDIIEDIQEKQQE